MLLSIESIQPYDISLNVSCPTQCDTYPVAVNSIDCSSFCSLYIEISSSPVVNGIEIVIGEEQEGGEQETLEPSYVALVNLFASSYGNATGLTVSSITSDIVDHFIVTSIVEDTGVSLQDFLSSLSFCHDNLSDNIIKHIKNVRYLKQQIIGQKYVLPNYPYTSVNPQNLIGIEWSDAFLTDTVVVNYISFYAAQPPHVVTRVLNMFRNLLKMSELSGIHLIYCLSMILKYDEETERWVVDKL